MAQEAALAQGGGLLLHPGTNVLRRREGRRAAARGVGALLSRPGVDVLEEVAVNRLELFVAVRPRVFRQAFPEPVLDQPALGRVE
jgi:hypothetical protein